MAPPIRHPQIRFDTFDVAVYRGYTIERRERGRTAQGHRKAYWEFRILGRPGWFTELELVLEEVDYLKAHPERMTKWKHVS
jgi:hypothetical protein